nr:hypothetical protein [Cellulosimicrobium funkei]
MLLEFLVQVHRPVAQAGGRDGDVGEHGDGLDGPAAGGDEDGPGLCLDHVGRDLLDRLDGAVQVEVELGLKALAGDIEDPGDVEGLVGRGEVQDVDASEALLDVLERGGDGVRLGDVGGKACRVDPFVLQLGGEGVELGGGARDERDGEALRTEGACDFEFQAGAGVSPQGRDFAAAGRLPAQPPTSAPTQPATPAINSEAAAPPWAPRSYAATTPEAPEARARCAGTRPARA